jgi:Zn-dependent metalloprotease
MINQGSTQEKIGKLNKKVVLKGKQVVKNAESTDSQLVSKGISKAYQGIHTGQIPVSRKPQIVITQMSKAKKTSQIYTLPAGPKEENEVKVLNKDRYEKNSKIIETTNPCIINKGKIDLSIEKEKLLLSFSSYYDKNPLSFDQTPSKQGKFRDSHSFSRMYQGLIVEKAPVSPKRRRPFDSKDMFKSSIVLC